MYVCICVVELQPSKSSLKYEDLVEGKLVEVNNGDS